jgi:alpha-galactosidase
VGHDVRAAAHRLRNTDVIALDQDPLGQQATIVSSSGGLVVYRKPLSNGDFAVALLNETSATATVSTTASAIGMPGGSSYTLKDLWSKATRTTSGSISSSVPAHGTVVYRVTRTGATPPAAGTRQLSDVTATSTTNGWGPIEKDRSNNTQAAGDGRTLTIGGTTFTKGLGVHAHSSVTYHLGGRCSTVVADVGIDDETGTNGRAVFTIWRDGVKVADSGVVTGSQGARHLTANVSGGTTLLLAVTDGGDGINSDHADWANLQVTCS